MISLEQKLPYGNAIINYIIIKSNRRRKTSELTVKKDGIVIVRSPIDKPISEIEGFIQKNARWILKKQLEYKKLIPAQIISPKYEEGSTLPYLGRNYPLRIMNHQKTKENKIELVDEKEFVVSLVNSKPSKKRFKDMYEEWLMEQAHSVFVNKVRRYSIQLEVTPSQVIIKNLKSIWGSATKDTVINLNVNLIKASEDVIDYVTLHEICHLKLRIIPIIFGT